MPCDITILIFFFSRIAQTEEEEFGAELRAEREGVPVLTGKRKRQAEDAKLAAHKREQEEEKQRSVMMLPKKDKWLYQRMMHGSEAHTSHTSHTAHFHVRVWSL